MRRMTFALLACTGACAPHVRAQQPAGVPPADSAARRQAVDSSRSFGTLSQSDLSLRLRNDELEIRFVPLNERVARLLAPDAYQSLHGLRAARQTSIDSLARINGLSEPGLALVTFYSQREGARFDPQILTVVSRGRFLRPVGVVPLTPGFSSQQLPVRGQATAIFLYEEQIPVDESFTLNYDALTSDDWQGKLPLLERERARVSARSNR